MGLKQDRRYLSRREVLDAVSRLEKASLVDIQGKLGFSFHSRGIKRLCKYLVRKDYLLVSKSGHYSLTERGKEFLTPLRGKPEITGSLAEERLVKKIAGQVAKKISGEMRSKSEEISIPPEEREEKVEIKTDFNYSLADENLGLETNIGKLGAEVEKESSDIEAMINSLKNIRGDYRAEGKSDERRGKERAKRVIR